MLTPTTPGAKTWSGLNELGGQTAQAVLRDDRDVQHEHDHELEHERDTEDAGGEGDLAGSRARRPPTRPTKV